MTEPLPSGFPEPLDNDDDDVAWALQTAKVQWQRGGKADAVVWIGRAADSADQLGNVWRAADLRRIGDEITQKLSSVRPAFSRPPPVSVRGGSDIDDLLGGAPPLPLPSYAPVDADELEIELESRPETFNEIVLPDPAARAELVSIDEFSDADTDEDEAVVEIEPEPDSEEVAEIEEVEVIEDDAVEDDAVEDDAIDDDALDAPAPLPSSAAEPLPSFASEPTIDPGMIDYSDGEDDPVTQPQLDEPLIIPAPPRSAAPAPQPEEDPRIGDLLLGEVHGLEDLPPESQALLAREVHVALLHKEEEVSSFGLALVLNGSVHIMPAIADLSCAIASKGDIVWGQGNLEDGVALRLVAAEDASVAVWDATLIKGAIRDCPWVIDDLKALADRFQALAGVAMGPMGERLDDSLRAMVTGRCEIKRLLPNEALAARGKPVGGMYIVAAGRVEIVDDAGDVESELGPGDFVFAPQVLSNGAAPRDARAGKGGALLLFAGRSVAHELLLSVPPLLEIFAS